MVGRILAWTKPTNGNIQHVKHQFRQGQPEVLTTDAVRQADVVVTMGCGDACPVFPGKRYEDWDLADPAGQPLDAVRPIRDDVRHRVQALVAELIPQTAV